MVLRRLAILVLVVLTLAAAGCGQKAVGQQQQLRHPSAKPIASLRWTIVGTSDVATLDPAQATDAASVAVGSLLDEGLVRLDSHLRVVPGVANYWSVSRDGLTYTFHIRPGQHFSNGDPLTSGDVAASLTRAMGPASSNGVMGTYLNEIATANGSPDIYPLGKSEIGIHLSHPSEGFLAKLTFLGAAIVDMGVLRRYGAIWTSHEAGLGPYRLLTWKHGSYLVLVRNNYYSPKPTLDRVTIAFAPSAAVAANAFANNRTAVVSQLEGDAGIQSRFGSEAHAAPALALDYIVFNNHHASVNNQFLRRALASAIDRKAMVRSVFGSTAVAEASLVPPSLLPEVMTERADTTFAVQSLAQSGHASGSSLRTLTFVYPKSPSEKKRALFLTAEWERVLGIHVKPVGLQPRAYGTAVRAGKFDLALVRWGAEYPDASDFLGSQLESKAADNISGWSNYHFDKLLQAATAAKANSPERARDLLGADQIATQNAIWIPLDSPIQLALIRNDVKGLGFTPAGLVGWQKTSVPPSTSINGY